MSDYPLSTGAWRLFYAVKSRYPHLEDYEVQQIGNIVLDEVSKRVGSGDSLAFFRLTSEGGAEIITYALEKFQSES